MSEFDRMALLGAALLHDIGHYPVSHATERAFIGSPLKAPTHKEVSRDLARDICARMNLAVPLGEAVYWLLGGELDDVKLQELRDEGFQPYRFKRQMVAGALDVDRLDFVLRDAMSIHILPWDKEEYEEFLKELVEAVCVHEHPDFDGQPDYVLAVRESHIETVLRFLWLRLVLYSYVYFHEEVRSLEGTYVVVFWLLSQSIGRARMLQEIRDASDSADAFDDEQAIIRFVTAMDDEKYMMWFFGLLDQYSSNMEEHFEGARKLSSRVREALEERAGWAQGFMRLPTSFTPVDVSPMYASELPHWKTWEKLLRTMLQSISNLPEVPVPDVLTLPGSEDAELLIEKRDGSGVEPLGSRAWQLQRHFGRRLHRVDFYASMQLHGEKERLAGIIDSFLESYVAKKG